mmetsp:Transcript_21916/g.28889  ORF Transcript_21916/g.28889 Transcript_21916/m.28889 type:complete len:110 (-) Transcript_21916:1185-1514(-)
MCAYKPWSFKKAHSSAFGAGNTFCTNLRGTHGTWLMTATYCACGVENTIEVCARDKKWVEKGNIQQTTTAASSIFPFLFSEMKEDNTGNESKHTKNDSYKMMCQGYQHY